MMPHSFAWCRFTAFYCIGLSRPFAIGGAIVTGTGKRHLRFILTINRVLKKIEKIPIGIVAYPQYYVCFWST